MTHVILHTIGRTIMPMLHQTNRSHQTQCPITVYSGLVVSLVFIIVVIIALISRLDLVHISQPYSNVTRNNITSYPIPTISHTYLQAFNTFQLLTLLTCVLAIILLITLLKNLYKTPVKLLVDWLCKYSVLISLTYVFTLFATLLFLIYGISIALKTMTVCLFIIMHLLISLSFYIYKQAQQQAISDYRVMLDSPGQDFL